MSGPESSCKHHMKQKRNQAGFFRIESTTFNHCTILTQHNQTEIIKQKALFANDLMSYTWREKKSFWVTSVRVVSIHILLPFALALHFLHTLTTATSLRMNALRFELIRTVGDQMACSFSAGGKNGGVGEEYSNQSTCTLLYLTYNTTLNSSVLLEKRTTVLCCSAICIILKS